MTFHFDFEPIKVEAVKDMYTFTETTYTNQRVRFAEIALAYEIANDSWKTLEEMSAYCWKVADVMIAAIVSSRVQRKAVEAHALAWLAEVEKEKKREKRWIAYLVAGMRSINATEIIDPSGVTLIERQPERDISVEILDERLIPEEYMRQPPVTVPPKTPDKNLMMKDMKAGIEVQGGRLVKKDRIKVGI